MHGVVCVGVLHAAGLEYCASLVVDGDVDPKYICYIISMLTHGLARFLSLNFASPHVCPINGPYLILSNTVLMAKQISSMQWDRPDATNNSTTREILRVNLRVFLISPELLSPNPLKRLLFYST